MIATQRRMGPLAGVRILEFDGLGPVTFAGMMLADMGAEVLRLARPAGSAAFEEVGGAVLHRGRVAVEVDLKAPADVAAVLDLAVKADAVIEGFRPGVLERLGLGPDVLRAANPALVIGRITGWGQSGPLALRAGHDLNYIGLTGALHAMGSADRPPAPPLNLVGDYGGGAMMLVAGVLAGVIEARATGVGRTVDAAMTDGTALLAGLFTALRGRGVWSAVREANLLDGGAPFYRCYACRDGRFVAVGALEPAFYARLVAGLGVDEPQTLDRTRWPAQAKRFAAVFATRDRDEWAELFEGEDACVTPVRDWDEAARHPHNVARGTFDEAGLPRPAPRFDGDVVESAPARRMRLDQVRALWA